ncbi:GNAT family N-acetyltransferase [Kitasatospora sp. NPDC057223]|uniref:GNAT family N-acetyltransferase n=1 Tax=Kitasatospora sp. NPDC057223 TaxID=3346055 RepID=UPI0036339F6E
MTYTIRPVRKEDWRTARELRLTALQDPVAHLAFLETYEQGLARPDEQWQERTAGAAEGRSVRQFVAEQPDGRWLGSVTVLVEPAGVQGLFGDVPEQSQTHLVGVFVRPEARGTGLAHELFQAALEWSWKLPDPHIERVRLFVHQDNSRAEAMYRRAGFRPTGASFAASDGGAPTDFEFVLPRA